MASFIYQALAPGGKRESGEVDAPNRAAALRQLKAKGLKVFKVEGGAAATPTDAAKTPDKTPKAVATSRSSTDQKEITGPQKLRSKELIRFTEELGDLLGAGLNLEEALRVLSGVPGGGRVAAVATEVRDQVRNGAPLTAALKSASPSFDHLYLSLVGAGEKGGVLGSVLERQATYLKSAGELQSKVVSSLVYPAILLFSGFALLGIFVGYLVPKLVVLLNATGGESSGGVQLIIGFSLFLNQYWWAVIIALVALAVGTVVLLKSEAMQPKWERWQLRLPLVGPVLRGRFHVTYLETLANLVRNGVVLDKALQLGADITDNSFVRGHLQTIAEEVTTGGKNLSTAMARSGIFDHPAPDIVRVGEQTGDHAASLSKAAVRFENDLEVRIARMTTAIQPVVLLLMAIVVGLMAYLMLHVIYDSINSIQTH